MFHVFVILGRGVPTGARLVYAAVPYLRTAVPCAGTKLLIFHQKRVVRTNFLAVSTGFYAEITFIHLQNSGIRFLFSNFVPKINDAT